MNNIETKYKMGQELFVLIPAMKQKIQSGNVTDIWTELRTIDLNSGKEKKVVQIAKYSLNGRVGPFPEEELFSSRDELVNSL